MIRKYLSRFIAAIKRDPKYQINNYWQTVNLVFMVFSMLNGLIRGIIKSFFFKSRTGFIIIKKRVIIKNANHISVGKNFIAEEGCEINGLSKRGLTFGDRVTIGAYALIRPSNYYGGEPGEGLKVGNNSNIGPFSYIGCSGFVEIGNNVMISPRVSIYSENHIYVSTEIPMKEQGVEREFVKIEDDCWIAANSIILAGVTIGRGSIIAAGSVVTKNIPSFSIVAGVPAKVIAKRIKE